MELVVVVQSYTRLAPVPYQRQDHNLVALFGTAHLSQPGGFSVISEDGNHTGLKTPRRRFDSYMTGVG